MQHNTTIIGGNTHMKMKNREVIARLNQLSRFSKADLPVKLTYAIARNLRKLDDVNKDFVETRNKLLDKYNVKDETGNPAYIKSGSIEISEEGKKDWEKDIEELLDVEIEVDIHEVDYSIIEGLNLSVESVLAIDFMIKE